MATNAEEPKPSTWTRASDGKTMTAKVITVSKEKATFQTEDGKQFDLDRSMFVSSDQKVLAEIFASTHPEPAKVIPSVQTNDEILKGLSEEEYRKLSTEMGFEWRQKDGVWIGMRGGTEGIEVAKLQINDSDIQSGFQSLNVTFLHEGEVPISEVVKVTEVVFGEGGRSDYSTWLSENLRTARFAGLPIHDRIVMVIVGKVNETEKTLTEIKIWPNSFVNSEAYEMTKRAFLSSEEKDGSKEGRP